MLAISRARDARARTMRVPLVPFAIVVLSLALSVAGCGGHSSDTTAPTSAFQTESPFSGGGSPNSPSTGQGTARGQSDYPLAIGNRWDYVLAARIETFPTNGSPSASNETGKWRAEVTQRTTVGGREYFSVEEGDPDNSWPPSVFLQREDSEGLFEYDYGPIMLSRAPASPGADPLAVTRSALAAHQRSLAGTLHQAAFALAVSRVTEKLARMHQLLSEGALATTEPAVNEITLLRYPLRAGASWTVRTSPFFGRVVVGQDEMVLPVGRVRAWRVQGVSELFGSDDRVYFWYGRAGLVRTHLHAVSEATDEYGNPIGQAIGEFDQSLAQVHLNPDPGPVK